MTLRPLKITGWIVVIAGVVLATIVLIYIGRGYSYDFHTGRLKLNGLVIFTSVPGGADISINGKPIHRRTPYRSTLEAGDYTFDITKDGYRPWTKRISIVPSEVTWAQYVLLLPTNLETGTWSQAAGVSGLVTSTDHKHFAFVAADTKVWTFDTGQHQPSIAYTPTAPAPGQPIEAVQTLEFSGDASRLLITTKSGDKTYQRLLTLGSGTVTNLSEQYGFDLQALHFNPTNAQELFWLSPDGLRRINTASQSLSAVLADHVATYTFGGNGQIVYIATTPLGKSLYTMDTSGQNKREQVQAIADSDSYQISYGSYKSDDKIAVLPNKSRTITLYSELSSAHPISRIITKSADSLSFNSDGRFINFRDGQRLATYDLELNRTYNFASSKTPYQNVLWFDTYHLLTVNTSGVSLVEFDGGNAAEISGPASGGQISFTSNQHEVLVVQPQSNGQMAINAITIKH
ncbi:MAG TPA: PEGA domain-containing protein [Candidatus Saccharimonadales bacterium]|nr:PEGA domain-containing protein [Candidatus Saccharimonadales bacterium]